MQLLCRLRAACFPAVALVFLAGSATALKLEKAVPNARVYPVTRVVELLKGMQDQLQNEQKSDKEVYEKLACWCRTNNEAKTKAISAGEAKETQLSSTVSMGSATIASVTVEVEGFTKEVATHKKTLATAAALRERQRAEFVAEEKDMVQAIQSLGAAIVVLSKHHSAALLDRGTRGSAFENVDSMGPQISEAVAVAAEQLSRHGALLGAAVTEHQKKTIMSLAKQGKPDLKHAAYKVQSGEIFGILKEMKSTFEGNLAESQKEESEAEATFLALKAAKEEVIKIGEESLLNKQEQLAAAEDRTAQAKQELVDVQAAAAADKKFLQDLEARCGLTDQEWEDRQKMRLEELQAVAEAIAVLSNDEARDTFSRTFNAAAFLQRGISLQSLRRQQAAAVLTSTAARTHNPVLSALASQVRLDAFTRVKEAIDQMVAELLQEASDEVKHRDFCIEESGKNERDTAKQVHTKAGAKDDVDRLKLLIEDHTSVIARLQSEITDLQTALQRATEDRDAENRDFSRIVLDQRETQRMLQQATDVLKRIYRPDATSSLVQSGDQRGNRQAPPPGFTKYEKQVGGGDGVLALLQQILADAKEMEAVAMHDEQEAVKALESFKTETDASVSAKQNSIINRQAEKGQAEQDLVEAESDFENAQLELGILSKSLADLKKSCAFFLDNFEVRSQARDEEVDALRQAKAFLAGMSTGGAVGKS